MRFDEIELQSVMSGSEDEPAIADEGREGAALFSNAPRLRRILALFTDLSLFLALALAMSPLLPASARWPYTVALGGFIVTVSYYYFVGCWMLWGKTVGGAIFDVKVVPAGAEAMSLRGATLRWAGIYAALVMGGAGFILAALPSRLSLPDRMSGTRCVHA